MSGDHIYRRSQVEASLHAVPPSQNKSTKRNHKASLCTSTLLLDAGAFVAFMGSSNCPFFSLFRVIKLDSMPPRWHHPGTWRGLSEVKGVVPEKGPPLDRSVSPPEPNGAVDTEWCPSQVETYLSSELPV